MHYNNRLWLQELQTKYPTHFHKAKVLEIGAKVWGPPPDHSIRPYTLMMFSVFEHDPTWRETIKHNLQWLKPGGVFATCFGAEGNLPHLMRWALVPHQEFLDYCKTMPLDMIDAFFEEDRYGKDCPGAYDAIARKV